MALEFISNTTFIVLCWKAICTYGSVTAHLFSNWVKQKVNILSLKFCLFFPIFFLADPQRYLKFEIRFLNLSDRDVCVSFLS